MEILRRANAEWWITHNGVFRNLDYRAFAADLDFMAVDVYPMLAFMDAPQEKSPAIFPARLLARTRSICGHFIVTELQSGPGGQGDWMSATPETGQMRLFAWQAVAHGAAGVLHFRWRTCRFGAEEYWEGVLDHDNVPRRRLDELGREGAEFAALGEKISGAEVRPDVGVLFDMGLMEFSHRPITHGLPSPWEVADVLYTAWATAGYNVGYVHPLDALDSFKLLFLCSNSVVTVEVVAALAAWVERGGTLVVLPRSGTKDEFGRVRVETPPGLLTELAGCTVEEHSKINTPVLVGSPSLTFQWDGQTCAENLWREVLQPCGGTIVGQWQEGRFAGAPAVVEHRTGSGRCFYIGTYASADLAASWRPVLARAAGVEPIVHGLPTGIEVTRRVEGTRALTFVLNHTANEVVVRNLPAGIDLITNEKIAAGVVTLAAFGVAVISTENAVR